MPLRTLDEGRMIYLPDEDVFGVLVWVGAFVSKVRYNVEGIEREVLLENDDFIFGEEVSIPFDEDDEE